MNSDSRESGYAWTRKESRHGVIGTEEHMERGQR